MRARRRERENVTEACDKETHLLIHFKPSPNSAQYSFDNLLVRRFLAALLAEKSSRREVYIKWHRSLAVIAASSASRSPSRR